jgi:hypothetical protein
MGGGLMQLVAYGAQDIYLTGNPQITFFKVVYRRHTNFSMEAIEQTLNGTVAVGNKVSCTISRNGDLVSGLTAEIDLTGHADLDNGPANVLDEVEVEIGGQRIDKHYGHSMETFAELTQLNPNSTIGTYADNDGTVYQNMSGMGGVFGAATREKAMVPLQFWFCKNAGLALPLIALQYHEVKVSVKLGSLAAGGTLHGLKLWADYVYLDTDERRRFAQVSHEYLIEQLQYQSEGSSSSFTLNFNHPVKELVWTGAWSTTNNQHTALTADNEYKLTLNGHDRFAARVVEYFTRQQVWQHHTGPGGLNANAAALGGKHKDSIAVYSFALKPEEHQPSGTCNFSRIDNAQLKMTSGTDQAVNIYAVNYNVLRIMSGMGGLAYSN